MKKQKCCKCRNRAHWCLMSGTDGVDDYFCDTHVPRGCSCNEQEVIMTIGRRKLYIDPVGIEGKDWKWKEKDKEYIELDGKGQEFPCCEYWHDKNGWDKDDEDTVL